MHGRGEVILTINLNCYETIRYGALVVLRLVTLTNLELMVLFLRHNFDDISSTCC